MRIRRSSPAKVGVVLLLAALATPLLGIPRASACSCMPTDPRDDLHASDGAFIGTYVGREPVDPTDPYGDYDYIFETETVFKGDVEEVVRVRAAANGATCGLEYQEGATGGLFLRRDGDVWRSNLCQTEHPERLRAAAAPFPQPDAEGPPRLLVGGSFGEVRVIALDAQGDVAGYGYGEGDALLSSPCPGGERSIEVIGSAFGNAPVSVDVRTLEDLSVERTFPGPSRWDDQVAVLPLSARCMSSDGDTALFVRGFDRDGESTEAVLFSGDGAETIDRGRLSTMAFGRGAIYAGDGPDVVELDYEGGGRRTIATTSGRVSHLAMSPNGRLLAGLSGADSGDSEPAARLFVLRVADGSIRSERDLGPGVAGELRWVSDRRLLLARRPSALIFDPDLEKKKKLSGWYSVSSAVIGCRLFGAGFGAVFRASICGGSGNARIAREFFSPITYTLSKLPRGTEIDAPPRD